MLAQRKMGKHARRNSITETDIQSLADVYLGDEDWIEVPVVKGDFHALPDKVKEYIAENVSRSTLSSPSCVTTDNELFFSVPFLKNV